MARLVGAVALAGPDWQSVELQGHGSPDPTVILISLSQTINATDQSPTRLAAAIHKASEILKEIDDGQVVLFVYADQPFIAVPPTDDDKVIDGILTQVSTDLVVLQHDNYRLAEPAIIMLEDY